MLVLVGCAGSDSKNSDEADISGQSTQEGESSSLFAAFLGERDGEDESQLTRGETRTPLLASAKIVVDPEKSVKPTAATRSQMNLNVGIVAFQPLSSSIPRTQSPLVRKAEVRYLPYVLKQTLDSRGEWGVVRVMPGEHGSAELNIEGTLLASDGERLAVAIKAQDSAGRLWLHREYHMTVKDSAYEHPGLEPFQPLFDRVAADLWQAGNQLAQVQRQQLSYLAILKYGERLLADGFSRYLSPDEQGVSQLLGLPAKNDPMFQRVQKLRRYEYFFVDTADEQYQTLFNNMQRTYHHWRKYSRELVVYMRDYEQRQAGQASGFRRGSLASMNEVYSDYEWFRMQERYLNELSSGFNNQVLPTVLELDDQVVHLEGGYEQQYQQWQKILAEIFSLERGP